MKQLILLSMLILSMEVFSQADDKSKEIINASIEATGGIDKMAAVKSMIRKMEISLPFGTSENETFVKSGKFYSKSMMNGQVGYEQKYDGTRGFISSPQGSQTIDDEKQLKSIAQQGKIFPLLDLESSGAIIKYLGTEKINGKECHKLSNSADGVESMLYFDVATKLISRMVSTNEIQGNKVETIIDLSDYKAVEGLQFAYKMNLNNGQFQMEMKTKEIKLNAEIADKMFLID